MQRVMPALIGQLQRCLDDFGRSIVAQCVAKLGQIELIRGASR